MTTLTPEQITPIKSTTVDVHPVTQARVLRSEWVKMRSLRSTLLTLAAAVATLIATGILIGILTNYYWATSTPEEIARFNPIDQTLLGYNLAQLAVCVLGVLLVTGEYATGMIRATFAAVPQRLPVIWAKAAVYAAVTSALMTLAALIAFLAGQVLLGDHGTTLTADGAIHAVVGVGVYLTLIGVLAVALGFIIRSTAGAVALLFGVLMVLPAMGLLLPASWQETLLPYLPSNAGSSMIATQVAPHALSATSGLLVLIVWVVGALALAAVLVKRRDA